MTGWHVRRSTDPPPEPPVNDFVLEDSLGYLVNRAARLMAANLAEELRPVGIGIGQWAALLVLWARDGVTQVELARDVAIEPPTLVRTLDRMVRDHLVERRPDPRDGRLSRVWLTERGRALRDELVPRAVGVNRRTEAALTPRQAEQLRGLLDRLVGTAG